MAILPVFQALLALSSGSFVVTRYHAGTYVAGAWQKSETPESVTIRASVQPAGGKELEKLPEGERISDNLVVFTETELYTRRGQADADRIEIEGATYEVLQVEDWHTEGGYYKALVRRAD